ncbi:DUF7079 family protein [Deinococcus sp.]|uniref:DUF7079 family protein n=1 Tax=Deinococcus sp. TaxID=47478 RepID=UPI003B5AD151
MLLSPAELVRRRPVWAALSELFLDTELDEADMHWLARTLRESGYPLAELEHILRTEVAPIVGGNLLSVVGVWSGFDLDWLERQILSLRGTGGLISNLYCRLIRDDWQRVQAAYLDSESEFAQPGS